MSNYKMKFKKFKPSFHNADLQCAESNLSAASMVVVELGEKLASKESMIDDLNYQVSELSKELLKYKATKGDNSDVFNEVETRSGSSSSRSSKSSFDEAELLKNIEKYSYVGRYSFIDDDESLKSYAVAQKNLNEQMVHLNLIKTYEETNSQLLEKLKVKECENQSLNSKVNELTNQIYELEDQLMRVNVKLQQETYLKEQFKEKAQGFAVPVVSHNAHNFINCGVQTQKCSPTISTVSVSVSPEKNTDESSIEDPKTFIADLFDSMSGNNNDKNLLKAKDVAAAETPITIKDVEPKETQERKEQNTLMADFNKEQSLKEKSSVASLQTDNSSGGETDATSITTGDLEFETHNYRNSCGSLLSLNKSAITPAAPGSPIASKVTPRVKPRLANTKSPSGKTIKSFTSSSKRRVQQLSLYLNPSRDNIHVPASPTSISSPISIRSSMHFNDEADFVFPNSGMNVIDLSRVPSLTNSSTMSTMNSSHSTNMKKLNFETNAGLKRVMTVKRGEKVFSQISMGIIDEL